MKRLAFLTVFCLLAIASLADAGGRRFGGCYSSSYYYPSYSYGYSYYPSYSYTPAYQAPAYTAPATVTYSKDWKTEALAIAKQQDDYQSFLKVAASLGLNVNGAAVAQAGYAAAPVVQGDTVFGYTVQQLQAFYGDNSRLVTGQMLARLTSDAKEVHKEFGNSVLDIAKAENSRVSVVAEILARGTAASQVAHSAGKAVEPQSQTVTQTTVQGGVGTTTQGGGVLVQQAQGDAGTEAFMATVARPLCASCHSGNNVLGKFDINTYPRLSAAEKSVVWERLLSKDPAKVMPRDLKDKTKPGTPLTPAQLAEFIRH